VIKQREKLWKDAFSNVFLHLFSFGVFEMSRGIDSAIPLGMPIRHSSTDSD
jgi:hypothetical protein